MTAPSARLDFRRAPLKGPAGMRFGVLLRTCVAWASVTGAVHAQPPPDRPGPDESSRGLLRNEPSAFQGYTLFAPLRRTTTYLIDMRGEVVHSWESRFNPGNSAYLLPDGSLLRAARDPHPNFHGGGIGGRIQRFDREGRLVWDFAYADENKCHHHDIEPLPSGNVLVLAWERKTREEAIAAGRNPETIGERGVLWPDHVVEIEPQGPDGGRVVWAWHSWDHLVQDFDPTRANYGKVEDHPERIDVNFDRGSTRLTRPEMQRLRGLGYVGGDDPDEAEADRGGADRPGPPGGRGGPDGGGADWHHTNAIDYHPKLDQIVLSVLGFNELWIIDHSTTTAEAAGHTGGRAGRGGDLLYRWGNPQTYRRGKASDQRLFGQHDVQWIDEGLPGAGHLLIFNNGRGRPDGEYSSVDELATPVNADGKYVCPQGEAFGPKELVWTYAARDRRTFFSGHISGAQRLPNGHTLICSGEQGRMFEVTREGDVVWEYRNPFLGAAGPGGPPRRPGADERPEADSARDSESSGSAATNVRNTTGEGADDKDNADRKDAASQGAEGKDAGSQGTEGKKPAGKNAGPSGAAPAKPIGQPANPAEVPARSAPSGTGASPPGGPGNASGSGQAREPGGRPEGGPGGGPERGPGGGPGRGPGSAEAVFRATRFPADFPGIARLLTRPAPSEAADKGEPPSQSTTP